MTFLQSIYRGYHATVFLFLRQRFSTLVKIVNMVALITHPITEAIANSTHIMEALEIKREVEKLSDRLGKTQDYL